MTKFAYVISSRTENGNVWVNVSHESPGSSERELPYTAAFPGAAFAPRQGEQVEIYKVDGQHFARAAHTVRDYPMPDLREGEFVFRFDEETEIRVTKNGGVFDLNLSASGTVTFGDDTLAKAVARLGDSVEVTDPLSGTLTGSITTGSAKTESE